MRTVVMLVITALCTSGLVAYALPWYVRNWLVAGSPLYPASVTIGHFTKA